MRSRTVSAVNQSRGLLPSFASQNPACRRQVNPIPEGGLGSLKFFASPQGETLDFHALYSLPQRGKQLAFGKQPAQQADEVSNA